MPPVVAAAAKIVGSVIFKSLIKTLVVNLVLSKISKALTSKPGTPRETFSIEFAETLAPRWIVYGQNRVGGLNVIPPIVTGNNGEYLHQVLVVAGTEIEAIDDVYFDDKFITPANSGTDGIVVSGPFANRANIRRYTGTDSQTVDTILDSALITWTSNHRGRGNAYVAVRYIYDTNVYKNGKPELKAVIRGRRVYDPRLDSSPGANPTNPLYRAYSTNPALCLADYLTLNIGVGDAPSRIDWLLVVAAANICDELVPIPGPATQRRYTCSIVLDAPTEEGVLESSIETLANAMMGACIYAGGRWRMYAGAWATPTFALTQDDVMGNMDVATAQSRKGGGYFNAVRGNYLDPAKNFQAVEFPSITSSAFEAQDGERIFKEVSFPACQSQYEAQRNSILLARQSRRRIVIRADFSLKAYNIRPYDVGTITLPELGLTNQTVRCVSWRLRPDPAIELTLQEIAQSDFNDPIVTDYTAAGSITIQPPASYVPGPVVDLTIQGISDGVALRWTAPDSAVAGVTYEVFEHTAASPFASATKIREAPQVSITIPRTDTTTRYYWVRSKYLVNTSAERPIGNGLAGTPTALSTGFRATAAPSSIFFQGPNSTVTSNSCNVSPVNGTGPFTYAWTHISGDASVAVSAPSAASTTFSTTGLANEEARSAVKRCTITDATSATALIDVSVTLRRENFS
jgi:hypothetical protein